ncbi:hypothetical protein J7E96_30495 [Streptomyces sp. ISL-96]|uniref:hypothetical protein n=1 Tax=Streptomyces sp. ISL-96 TaxID=2819191 RepID=UPI001BE5F587|nr:hypothetical protein [Streptomyces sp. ISL-96]MBT2492764.1 hypothetical protein [Streptomyces sp. ISL-96]
MPHILPNACAVGWNMTNTKRPDTATVRMGQWVFTPACVRFAREANATLHDNDRCIVLRYSSSILESFLKEMGSIEAEFVTLSTTVEAAAGPVGQQTGRRLHA